MLGPFPGHGSQGHEYVSDENDQGRHVLQHQNQATSKKA